MNLLWISAFAALLGVLFWASRRLKTLGRTVLLALFLGLGFGWLLTQLNAQPAPVLGWVQWVAGGYIHLLHFIAMPLVFVSILAAIARLERAAMVGQIALWVLAVLLGTTAIAALDGAVFAHLFGLNASSLVAGHAELAREHALVAKQGTVSALTLSGMLLSFIPQNLVATLAELKPTAMISAVITAALFGFAALKTRHENPEAGAKILGFIDAAQVWILALVRMVIRLTPYGVAALMIKIMATTKAEAIVALFWFLLASYLALLLMFGVHGLIIAATGRSPKRYFQKVWPVLVFAFSSRSSAATMPLNIQAQTDKLGVAPSIANMAASLGATIGQNGCAGVYPAMLAMMTAPVVGIDPWSLSFVASVVLIAVIASFGVAGVGGGATFAGIIVLSTLGLPIELAGLLISIEPLIDMMRTALNVNGAMTAGVVTERILGPKLH